METVAASRINATESASVEAKTSRVLAPETAAAAAAATSSSVPSDEACRDAVALANEMVELTDDRLAGLRLSLFPEEELLCIVPTEVEMDTVLKRCLELSSTK